MSFMHLMIYAEAERKKRCLRIQRRRLRDVSDPLQLPETEFVASFRLTKPEYLRVLSEVQSLLPASRRTTAVRNELKVLAALSFYANGSYQRSLGASVLNNMAQPTFSKCLHEVTNALNTPDIFKKYVKFPLCQTQRETIINKFMEKFGFPGVIGCIDGTHVAIVRPNSQEEAFFNRKNYHSLNVLIICDANLRILYVDARFGGASHDSYVWNQCAIKPLVENLPTRERCWLLGDSGYAQRPWMMTPILGAAPGSPDDHYTIQHCRVRNTVERCIGVLKARWRCLLGHRVLHYDPVTAAKIVNACVTLHNIANARNASLDDPQYTSDDNDDISQQPQREDSTLDPTRDILVRQLWSIREQSQGSQ